MPDSTEDPPALSLFQKANGAYLGGNSRRALEILDQALAAVSMQDVALRSSMLLQKAEWARETGRTDLAEAALNEAASLVEQLPVEGHETEWASLRSAQAYLARAEGDFASAAQFYEQAADLAARSPACDLLLPDVYANRAAIYLETGELGDAQEVLLKALEIDQRVGNARSESNDLNMLGLVSKHRGDGETARAYFLKAVDVANRNGLTREAMDAIANFSADLDDAGEHAKAAELFRDSAALLAEAGDEAGLACAVANQGVAAANAGDLEGSIAFLKTSHELHLATGNQTHAVADLINLARAEAELGRHDQALTHAEEALRNAHEYGAIELLWRAEYQVATLRATLAAGRVRGSGVQVADGEELSKELSAALAGYRRAIDYIELLRSNVDRPDERHAMFTGKEQVYGAAISLALGFGLGRDALELSERARTRSFLDALGGARVERLESADPAAGRRSELVARLLDPGTPPADKPTLMNELRTVRAEMIARQPAVAAITEAELPSSAEILAAIPSGTAMLVYYQLDDKTILTFPMSPDGGLPEVGQVQFDEPVEKVVRDFRREIKRGDRGLPTGNKLFAALFRPVMPLLATTQNVIIVPHGALHYLPFSALWFVPAGDDAPPREYLRTRFVQANVPSASYLPFLNRIFGETPAYGPPVVLGNPTGDLQGAEEEAQNAAAILAVRPFLGAAATRDALLAAGSPSVLHVASHGVYDATDPLLSRLVMADGGVTVEDLLAAGPAPGLLVLSGCVTGLSDRKPGDELIGLAQAMLRRGTRAVVATLWETFDESSALFFEHFYQALMSGNPVNEAMTIARQYLATGPGGFDQPVDWAPFVLIGDPGHRLANPAVEALRRAMGLFAERDLPGALAAFREVTRLGDASITPLADYSAGQVLGDLNDIDGALAAYQRAIDSGHQYAAPLSALDVGTILMDRGDIPGARAAFQRAIDSNHEEAAPKAAYNLGVLLSARRDKQGAIDAYRRAMESGVAEIAPAAAVSLGALLAAAQDTEGAVAAWQMAIESGDPGARPVAAYNLGLLLAKYRYLDDAKAALAIAAAESRDPRTAKDAAKEAARLERIIRRIGPRPGR